MGDATGRSLVATGEGQSFPWDIPMAAIRGAIQKYSGERKGSFCGQLVSGETAVRPVTTMQVGKVMVIEPWARAENR